MVKETWNDTQKLLAFVTVGSFVFIILVLIGIIYFPPKGADVSVVSQLIAAVITLVGSLGGMAGAVNTFYYGSSKSSSTKDDTISGIANRVTETPPATNGKPAETSPYTVKP